MAKVAKDLIDKFFDYNLDIQHRTVYLGSQAYTEDSDESGVDFLMAENFIKAIYLLEKDAPNGDSPINIIMNNPGGDCTQGMAIYDAIKNCKNHVTITVFGNAASMGCVILQAADERILAPFATVMFHEGYDGYNSNHPEIIKRWLTFNTKFGDRINNILYNRILEKHPEFKMKKFKDMNVFDTILDSKEAVELGLADKIL